MTDYQPNNKTTHQHQQISERKKKLAHWRQQGKVYPNHFRRDALAHKLHQKYDDKDHENLVANKITVKVAGRMMTRRIMGKASFCHLQDMSGRIQIYVKKNDLPNDCYNQFIHFDIGDIIGVNGYIFKTKTNELSIHATSIELLTKALRPLPDKFHGLANQELRYRRRYVDLIVNDKTRQVFLMRSQIITAIRDYLSDQGFIEVETPMMHAIPGGAVAKPFETYHHALDMPLYLRIAPELYLKRLVVGGFEKVFEINRSFRNEGLSPRHNPEFTMLEFYQAYANCHDMMTLTQELLQTVALKVLGTTKIDYQGEVYDMAKPFIRMTLKEAILHFNKDINLTDLEYLSKAKALAKRLAINTQKEDSLGKLQLAIFETLAESKLRKPTFITGFPIETSPLSRCCDNNPDDADRFELFIAGREIANSFSELNDPQDQARRFQQQASAKAKGDEEAMYYDDDYICALEYGMPPTAGEGIGIDRLVMLFTQSASIRDVLLFPHLRAKNKG